MMASDKDVVIKKFNKRNRDVHFGVFGSTVTLKFTRDNELYIDRRHYPTKALDKTLALLEDYLCRIGLVRYGTSTYRFTNYLSIAALKIVHTLHSPGSVTADTYKHVSAELDTYLIPADLEEDPTAEYARIFNAEGRRAVEMLIDHNGYRIEVLYSDGYMPLFSVTRGADVSIVKYALHAAISAYKMLCNDPINEDWIDVASDDYYKYVFTHLKRTDRPEFNVMRPKETPEPDTPIRENPVDINVVELLNAAEPIKDHLAIGVCVPLAALAYDGLYFTVGSVTGYDSNGKYTMLRIQYYRKRPVERDNKVPMHLAAVANYGVVSFAAPDGVKIVNCDGMDPAEFAGLVEQYAAVLRR